MSGLFLMQTKMLEQPEVRRIVEPSMAGMLTSPAQQAAIRSRLSRTIGQPLRKLVLGSQPAGSPDSSGAPVCRPRVSSATR